MTYSIVLPAALFHALWNSMIKSSADATDPGIHSAYRIDLRYYCCFGDTTY